jgi:hypothetical protein
MSSQQYRCHKRVTIIPRSFLHGLGRLFSEELSSLLRGLAVLMPHTHCEANKLYTSFYLQLHEDLYQLSAVLASQAGTRSKLAAHDCTVPGDQGITAYYSG